MQVSHPLQALGQGGLPKSGKGLTGQDGWKLLILELCLIKGMVLGRLMIGCLVSSILGGLGMMEALVLLSS